MVTFYNINKKKFINYKFHGILHLREYKRILKCIHKNQLIETPTGKMYLQLAILIWHLSKNKKETDHSLKVKKHTPYIIGINGSISSGKSYLAHYMTALFKCLPNHPKISILSTDNFIYTNKQLKRKKLMKEKGFPSSYNWKLLFNSLERLRDNKKISVPTYNQDISDIDPHHRTHISKNQDFIIVEGINLFKPTCQDDLDRFLLSDYLDYSIYITTKETFLKKWFYKRLTEKVKRWKKLGRKNKMTRKNTKGLKNFSNRVWQRYNKVNLIEFIRPYKYRANVIITQDMEHRILSLAFRL